MRPSQKRSVVAAAIAIAEEQGIPSVTIERTATRAGMTKGGVLYHFGSKEALLLAVAELLADRCADALHAALGKALEESTAVERIRAYVQVVAETASTFSLADAAIRAEGWFSDDLKQPWFERLAPWFAPDPNAPAPTRSRLDGIRLAADGLWLAEAAQFLAPGDRTALINHLLTELELCADT